jgi:DNA-binding CsgD family transcriptional regulator
VKSPALTKSEFESLRVSIKDTRHGSVTETAAKMGVTEQTVKNQRTSAYRKLGVHSLLEAGLVLGLIRRV